MNNDQLELRFNRRAFVQSSAVASASFLVNRCSQAASDHRVQELENTLGIVSASAQAQLTGRAKGRTFSLLELPRIMRDELDMRIIDLNTASFPDFAEVETSYLDKLKSAADDAGCLLTNLKMNQRGFDMNSPDPTVREKAIQEYKRSIKIAAHLGCRWVRPLPGKVKPNLKIHIASYQELCDFASQHNVQLLVENFGWMQADPESVRKLVSAIGHNVAAGIDTGNWDSNAIRYSGLAKSFPFAATCDFKAKTITKAGEHPQYNLRKCFDIAWASGFHGPWCFEHANPNTDQLFQEFRLLRDLVRKWTAENSKNKS